MEKLILQDKDVVIYKGRYSSPANEYFKEVVARNFAAYEAMPTITNQSGGPKQVLREQIVNEMMAEGYRFVIGYKPNCENLSLTLKRKRSLSIVQASFERETIKIENAFKILRNSKVRPATNLITTGKITDHFKKRKAPPGNII